MDTLKMDLRLCSVILAVNMTIQSFNEKTKLLVIFYMITTAIMMGLALISIKKQDKKVVQYVYVAYALQFIMISMLLASIGLLNVYNTAYGFVWTITIMAYIISLSYPIVSAVLILVCQLMSSFIQLIVGDGTDQSLGSIATISIAAIVVCFIRSLNINKTINKNVELKDRLGKILLYKSKPLKINTFTHIIVWSIIITSIISIAKGDLYKIMNEDMKYAMLASASVIMPTFLIMGALSASVLIIEIFALYTVLEWYTLSYIVAISTQIAYGEILTVVLDTMILVCMLGRYKSLKNTQTHTTHKSMVEKCKISSKSE